MHKRTIIPLSVVIKTYMRPMQLERLLLSIVEYEVTHKIAFAEIVIGDDSPYEDLCTNKKIISNVQLISPSNIRHIVLEPNIGTSAGRNRTIDNTTQNFILLCDDDFIFDMGCDLGRCLETIKQSSYSILGGWLKNHYNILTGESEYWGTIGKFAFNAKEWVFYLNENSDDVPEIADSDYILQFFIAKTELFTNIKWDEELRTEEHRNFFLELYKSKYKVGFCKELFIKHTGNPAENTDAYNQKRHGSVCRAFSQLSLKKANFQRCVYHRWRKEQYVRWIVELGTEKYTHLTVPLREPILAQRVPIRRLSPKYQDFFFGYYDIKAASEDGKYILFQSAPTVFRLPDRNDVAKICFIEPDNPDKINEVGTTSAWCHQQGSHLQFLGTTSLAIYNTFDEATQKFESQSVDIHSKQKAKKFPLPVSAVSQDGKLAASLNFSRLFDFRPGYGYGHIPDPYGNHNASKNDGVFLMDLESGEYQLELSLYTIRNNFKDDAFAQYYNSKLIINHVSFCPDSNKFLLLVRIFNAGRNPPTFTLVYNIKDGSLSHIFGLTSHYHWKDNSTIIVSGSPSLTLDCGNTVQVWEVNVTSGLYKQIAPGILQGDGHCSYSPDRTLLLYDSYNLYNFPYRKITIYNTSTKKCINLGYFYSNPDLFNNITDLRCDLHPRWSPDGRSITFDSIHEGFRGVYEIKTDDILHSFADTASYADEEELKIIYRKRYLKTQNVARMRLQSILDKRG
jgi:glycosyltransferase involved in cell wall biosynthesis